MTRLLEQRYLICSHDRARDLVTGKHVRIVDAPAEAPASGAPLPSLVEVLDHGREGEPRWLVAGVRDRAQAAEVIRRAADDARRRGFVAISVESYLQLRHDLADDLRERALVLIGSVNGSPEAAHMAFAHASALSPRPHLLLTFRTILPTRSARPQFVREARPAYWGEAHRPRRLIRITPDIERLISKQHLAAQFHSTGRHAAAERVLREVAAAFQRRSAPAHAARALIDLGRLLMERGRSDAADRTFERASEVAAAEGETLPDARIWQAAARIDAGRLTEAESIVRALLLTTADPAARVWLTATLARVLLWQGRLEEAASTDIGTIAGDLDQDGVTSAWVEAVAVRILLAGGRTYDAGVRATAALGASERASHPLARVIAQTARLRVLAAAGTLDLAEAALQSILAGSRHAHAPLRALRARLIWWSVLRQAGRRSEADRELMSLRRMRPVCPPLLQHALDAADTHPPGAARVRAPQPGAPPLPLAVALIRIAQDEEDDGTAVRRLLGQLAAELETCRTDLVSSDAGPVSTLCSVGSGLATQLGGRVLSAGISLGPHAIDGAAEVGVPVRLGCRLVGAIVCRWPADRVPPRDAVDIIELTTAAAAPRVDALQAGCREAAACATSLPELVGVSAAMTELRGTIARAAAAPFAVLIEGESGVGKELVARAIHQLGPRRERPFCDLNCAALPDELLESELFGHARGAFTGALTDRAGLFEDAGGGTVFLDELPDLSARAQAKLLRVLQQQEVRRVGETFSRRVDVRVIAAANRDMRREVVDGRFRQDLLYRLDVIRVSIPPLRDRPDDIPLLAAASWRVAAGRVGSAASLAHDTLRALAHYSWPGNVRELQNVLAALAVAAPARGLVRPRLLPGAIAGATQGTSGRLDDGRRQFERRFIEAAVARAAGSRTRAARELGISRQGLLKMMARLGIEAR